MITSSSLEIRFGADYSNAKLVTDSNLDIGSKSYSVGPGSLTLHSAYGQKDLSKMLGIPTDTPRSEWPPVMISFQGTSDGFHQHEIYGYGEKWFGTSQKGPTCLLNSKDLTGTCCGPNSMKEGNGYIEGYISAKPEPEEVTEQGSDRPTLPPVTDCSALDVNLQKYAELEDGKGSTGTDTAVENRSAGWQSWSSQQIAPYDEKHRFGDA